MKAATISILTFLASLLSYGFIGFLSLLYNPAVSSAGASMTDAVLFTARVETVVFSSTFLALLTAAAVYFLERGK